MHSVAREMRRPGEDPEMNTEHDDEEHPVPDEQTPKETHEEHRYLPKRTTRVKIARPPSPPLMCPENRLCVMDGIAVIPIA